MWIQQWVATCDSKVRALRNWFCDKDMFGITSSWDHKTWWDLVRRGVHKAVLLHTSAAPSCHRWPSRPRPALGKRPILTSVRSVAGLSLQRHPGLRKFTISGTDGIIRAGLSWSQYDLERFFRKNQWRFCGALSHFKPRNLMAVWWWITGLVWNPRCPGMVYGPGPKLKWDRPRTVCWAAQTKLWSSLIRVAGIRAERPQDVQNHCLFMLVFLLFIPFPKNAKAFQRCIWYIHNY